LFYKPSIFKNNSNTYKLTHPFLDFKIIAVTDTQNIIAECSGNAQKGIFISYPSSDEPMVDFLTKILSAVKLDLQKDVLVLGKTPNEGFSFSGFAKQVGIQKAIIFGIAPKTLGLQINHQKYQPFILNDCLFLYARFCRGDALCSPFLGKSYQFGQPQGIAPTKSDFSKTTIK